MQKFKNVLKVNKLIIGVIHPEALPGAPKYRNNNDSITAGPYFKKDGYWENELDYDRVSAFMEDAKRLRSGPNS